MEIDHFDTDFFIDEIQKRSAIWDMENPDYKNKVLKKRYWEELVELFCRSGDNLEKKKLLGTMLVKRWKSIRDNYIRESKRQRKLPSGSSKHTPYVYYRKLRFLESSTANNKTESNNEATNCGVDSADIGDLKPLPKKQIKGPRTKQKINSVDKQMADILQKTAIQHNETASLTKEDDDKLFCLSLYSELKKVPENRRITTKIELLKVIERAQNDSL